MVNQYYVAGLDRRVALTYVPTVSSESSLGKVVDAVRGVATFSRALPECDVVHLHASVRGSFRRKRGFARRARGAGKRIVVTEHSGEFAKYFEGGTDVYRAQVREFFGWADRVLVLSEEWRGFFAENVCDPSKIVVMHNAVKMPVPLPAPVDCPPQSVLFLGRLAARKSPDVLLCAAKTVLESYPKTIFRFGGDGEPERYVALAEELGIASSCEFLGWVSGEEKERLLRQGSVFCLPSRAEGMPMSVLEAMSYGVATVATPVGGTPQIIRDGENGFLMPVGDSERLAEIICELLGDDGLCRRIGEAGRVTVEERFNIDKNIDELVVIYEQLMSREKQALLVQYPKVGE